MIIKTYKVTTLYTISVILIIALITYSCIGIKTHIETSSIPLNERNVIIIDPGHGGVDPGAIGVNKCLEKDINLSIAICLRDIFIANGYEVMMTRDSDLSIHDDKYKKISQIKTSDLKNRLKIIDSVPNAIAISIHQNEYTSESSSGAQMFYGKENEQSEILAQSIQKAFSENLQPNNKRQIKRSTKDVYIIHNAKNPIVLAECGFISNYKEANILCDKEYQQKVAFTIFCGIINAKNESINKE